MEVTVATWVFVSVFAAITIVSVMEDRQKLTALERFRRYVPLDIAAPERRQIDRTFQQRIIDPMVERLQKLVNTRLSESFQDKLQMRLLNAGYPLRTTPVEYLVKAAIGVGVFTLVVVGCLLAFKREPAQVVSFSLLAFLGSGLLSSALLRDKANARRVLIEREMPELLDYIQVAVEAGLSIDSAIERIVSERPSSILAYEFRIYLNDVKMGLTRSEALAHLAARTNSKYVKSFTDGISQAVKTGMPMGSILAIIRKDVYDDIRSNAEKRAYKAPILMMIPMAILIFPTVFIITLAPAILKLMAEVGNMGLGK
ncbi:type II secretion system F family protein [bacterium]|nr:type II secretion system F family protein [bacterium]